MYLCSSERPSETLSLWERSLSSRKELPLWSEMNTFLTCRYEVVERLGTYRATKPKPQFTHFNPRAANHSSTFINKNRTQNFHGDSVKPVSCKLCNSNHAMKLCVRFKNLSVPDRLKFVGEHKNCENCFHCSHLKGQCQRKFSCVYWQQRQRPLLHFQANQQNSTPIIDNAGNHSGNSRRHALHVNRNHSYVTNPQKSSQKSFNSLLVPQWNHPITHSDGTNLLRGRVSPDPSNDRPRLTKKPCHVSDENNFKFTYQSNPL